MIEVATRACSTLQKVVLTYANITQRSVTRSRIQWVCQVIIRAMAEADVPVATVLLGQLGYDMPETEAARRFAVVWRAEGHRVWVAEEAGRVVGLLHAFFRPALDKPPEVMVQALVIEASQAMRRASCAWIAPT